MLTAIPEGDRLAIAVAFLKDAIEGERAARAAGNDEALRRERKVMCLAQIAATAAAARVMLFSPTGIEHARLPS